MEQHPPHQPYAGEQLPVVANVVQILQPQPVALPVLVPQCQVMASVVPTVAYGGLCQGAPVTPALLQDVVRTVFDSLGGAFAPQQSIGPTAMVVDTSGGSMGFGATASFPQVAVQPLPVPQSPSVSQPLQVQQPVTQNQMGTGCAPGLTVRQPQEHTAPDCHPAAWPAPDGAVERQALKPGPIQQSRPPQPESWGAGALRQDPGANMLGFCQPGAPGALFERLQADTLQLQQLLQQQQLQLQQLLEQQQQTELLRQMRQQQQRDQLQELIQQHAKCHMPGGGAVVTAGSQQDACSCPVPDGRHQDGFSESPLPTPSPVELCDSTGEAPADDPESTTAARAQPHSFTVRGAEVESPLCQRLAEAGTMKRHLKELESEDAARIFIARRINRLGFTSAELLREHFSRYGEVKGIYVSNSRVKAGRGNGDDSSDVFRIRAAVSGFVVMASAEPVAIILAEGSEHEVNGVALRLEPFRRRPTA